ncbi:hypothetical protein [Glaciecola sp. SC05]|uniref:hypothetical protein n=1 Tax=Glaciecola sp. SC05 TaxID=1987355 RepID=UPI003528243B
MRSRRHILKFFVALFASSLLLSACGGGGSGSSGIDLPPPPPPPPPPVQNLLIDYAPNASIGTLSSIDSMLQIGYVSQNTIFYTSSYRFGTESSCSNGGLFTHTLTDNDDNQRLSTGDTLITTYRECYIDALQEITDGSIVYTVNSLDSSNGYEIILDASELSIGNDIGLSGDIHVHYDVNQTGTELTLASNNPLRVTANSQLLLTLNDFEISKTEQFTDAKYTLSASGSIRDEAFDGTYSFQQITPFSGFFNEYPNDGELIISASETDRFTIKANFVEDSSLFDIESNSTVISRPWLDAIEGAMMAFNGQIPQFIYDFRSDNFAFVGNISASSIDSFGLSDSISWMFSRPVSMAELNFGRLEFEPNSFPRTGIPALISIDGALVTITPQDSLQAGITYNLPNLTITSTNQSTYSYFGAQIQTSTDIIPIIQAQSLLYRAGDTPWLDATSSTSNIAGELSFEWSELSNTGISFNSPDQGRTEFTLGGDTTDNLVVQVTISNQEGYKVTKTQEIRYLSTDATFLSFDSPQGDFIGQGQQQLYTALDGEFLIQAFDDVQNYIGASFNGNDNWNLDLAAPRDDVIGVGVYNDATRYPFQSPTLPGLSFFGSGRGCNQSSGMFEILELERDMGGTITRFAVNFTQNCEFTMPALIGQFRLNSALPLNPK